MSVSICITSFMLFTSMPDRPHFASQHVMKDNAENSNFFFFAFWFSHKFLPIALRWLTIGHLLKKVNKPARNLPAPVKGWDLIRPQWKVLIAIEGYKLQDIQSSAVICQACKEFHSRRERQNFNWRGVCFKITVHMCSMPLVVCIFSWHCVCCTQDQKSVCNPWPSQYIPSLMLSLVSVPSIKFVKSCVLWLWNHWSAWVNICHR